MNKNLKKKLKTHTINILLLHHNAIMYTVDLFTKIQCEAWLCVLSVIVIFSSAETSCALYPPG
jgi:hypothetical protein